jgi:hypothetical protein
MKVVVEILLLAPYFSIRLKGCLYTKPTFYLVTRDFSHWDIHSKLGSKIYGEMNECLSF